MFTLVLFLVAAFHHAQSSEVGYQLHSFNDMRQWPSMISKSSHEPVWLKIDLYYAEPSFCTAHSGAISRVHHGENGCFLLNHDTPTLNRSIGYNTSDDVLALINHSNTPSDSPVDQLFTQFLHRADGQNSSIALCFKYDFGSVCDSTDQAARWLALTEEFYQQANELISVNNLTLTFVLDGAGSMGLGDQRCLVDRFVGWSSTYIPDVSDPSTLNWGNQSINHFLHRMDLLNMDESTFPFVQKSYSYGRFINSTLPFLVYEPSEQYSLTAITYQYWNGLTDRHAPGFRFAVNIDIPRFQIYTSEVTGDAWNARLPFTQALTRPKVAVISSPRDDVTNVILLHLAAEGNQAALSYSVRSFDRVLGSLKREALHVDMLQVPSSLHTDGITSFQSIEDSNILLVSDTHQFVLYDATVLTDLHYFYSNFPHGSNFTTGAFAAAKQAKETLIIAQVVLVDSIIHLFVSIFHIPSHNFTQVSRFQQSFDGDARSVSLAVAWDNANHVLNAVVVIGTNDLAVLAATFSVDWSSYRLIDSFIAQLDVGSDPTVSLARLPEHVGQDVQVMITAGNSYCANSEVFNKQADAPLCNHVSVAQSSVLSYARAGLADLKAELKIRQHAQQNDESSWNLACSVYVQHGTYDMGLSPHSTLFVAKGQLGVVAVHRGTSRNSTQPSVFDGHSLATSSMCGAAVPFDGLIIDSWPLTPSTSYSSTNGETWATE